MGEHKMGENEKKKYKRASTGIKQLLKRLIGVAIQVASECNAGTMMQEYDVGIINVMGI